MSQKTRPNNDKKKSENTRIFRTEVCEDNPELLKRAKEELNENPETRERDIAALREMVLAEPHLVSPTDDAFLLGFLRGYKFDVKEAFELVKKYYNVRVQYPDLFIDYRPSRIVNAMKENMQFLLPNTDQLGRSILLARTGRWDPKNSSPDDQITLMYMIMEAASESEKAQVNGIILLVDLKHFGLSQAIHGTPSILKKLVDLFQDVFPLHIKAIHYINNPSLFQMVFTIMKPFLNAMARELFHFHGHNLQSLYKHVNQDCLPEEYGGSQPSFKIAAEAQMEYLLARDDEMAKRMKTTGYIKK